ncbi:MAG: hypothetical protein ACXVP0_11210 [Bacteroidia bacterium]
MKTLRLLGDEPRYEKRFNIKTLLIKKSDDQDNYHYQGASYYVLLNLLKKIPAKLKNKPFIDYGSGKGRALFCAEYCGFDKLIGVELDLELVRLSEENVKNYAMKRPESTFTMVHQNALDYEIPPDAAVFYFFNPFSAAIMKQVAAKIVESQRQHPREVLVVYVNPQHKDVWEENGFTLFLREGNRRYAEALVYRL